MTITDTPELATGPIACTSWCQGPAGHDTKYADDQSCFGAQIPVPMSTSPRLTDDQRAADETDIDHVDVYPARRGGQNGQTVVGLLHSMDDTEMYFTADEARQLVAAVQQVLEQIEAGA